MRKLLAILCFMAVLFGCQPEELPIVQDSAETPKTSDLESDKELLKFLRDYRYKIVDVEDLGESYLIDKCIGLNKNLLKSGYYSQTIEGSENAHAIMTPLVDAPHWNERVIRVLVDPSIPTSGVDNWRPEVAQALADLTEVKNFALNFEVVTSGSFDIMIKSDFGTLPSYVLAQATPPANDNPGNTIIINLDYSHQISIGTIPNWTVPTLTKRRTIIHEIGHCIGFRHTNYEALDEPISNAIYVSGTFNNIPSVMNGGSVDGLVDIQAMDILAFRDVYPIDPGEKGLFTYVKNHSSTVKSHNWTGYWADHSQLTNNGFQYRGATGFVYLYQKANTVPLYRYQHVYGAHYITTNANLTSIDPSYTLDKLVGYVYTTAQEGRNPVYEYYHNNEGHYFTPFSNDPYVSGPGWSGGGAAFYVEWFE